ncbi:hypothetical protein OQA88_5638 [Cercophora sp. LCS_1]
MSPLSLADEISVRALLLAGASLATAWLASRVIYNRYFHPLAHVLGPFLASVSEPYRFYHNFANGALYLQFEGLRDKYGPVIRTAPNEALLTDPAHYAVDLLTGYAFGSENCFRSLDDPDFGVLNNLMRGVTPMIYFLRKAAGLVRRVMKEIDAGIAPGRPTIFHTILSPPSDAADTDAGTVYQPTPMEHLIEEPHGLIGASSDTAGVVICKCTLNVLKNPDVRTRLVAELAETFPGADPTAPLNYQTLERLPYLTAVVKEGLRVAYALSTRVSKIRSDATFPQCVVSMSSYLMHRDATAFPNPDTFDPTRWLDDDSDVVRFRERSSTPFSRGSRARLGQPLALCEIYLTVGTLFHWFEHRLQAYDVGLEDLAIEDYFIPFHPATARKFRVLVDN